LAIVFLLDAGVTILVRFIAGTEPVTDSRHRRPKFLPHLPDPDVAKLGRTLRQWRTEILAGLIYEDHLPGRVALERAPAPNVRTAGECG
jgi:hypothetical protein